MSHRKKNFPKTEKNSTYTREEITDSGIKLRCVLLMRSGYLLTYQKAANLISNLSNKRL